MQYYYAIKTHLKPPKQEDSVESKIIFLLIFRCMLSFENKAGNDADDEESENNLDNPANQYKETCDKGPQKNLLAD